MRVVPLPLLLEASACVLLGRPNRPNRGLRAALSAGCCCCCCCCCLPPNRLSLQVPVVPVPPAVAAGLPAVRGAGAGLLLTGCGGAGFAFGCGGAGLLFGCGSAGLALGAGACLMGRPLLSTCGAASFLVPSLKML